MSPSVNEILTGLQESSDSEDENRYNHQKVNLQWHEEAHYVPVLPNSHNLSIREQPLPMRRMICASVTLVTGNSLFDSAYPFVEKAEFDTYYRNVFVKCAKQLKYSEIVKHIQNDEELVKLCARVVSILVSHLISSTSNLLLL